MRARPHAARRAAVALLAALAAPPVFASLALFLFGPKDWPTTLALVREKFPLVRQYSTAEVARRLASSAPPVLIDTRAPAEYAVSHLAGALNAASEEAVARIVAQAPAGREIIVYCSVGYRSSAIAQRLLERKLASAARVGNLEGSIFTWANEGRPIVRIEDGQEVVASKVHPYNAQWAKLLAPERRAAQ